MNLNTFFLGHELRSPLVIASGLWSQNLETMINCADEGVGAITTKSCSLEPRDNHPIPIYSQWKHGSINSVGLGNPGAKEQAKFISELKQAVNTKIIASIFGSSPEEYIKTALIIADSKPDFIEVNISCPNTSGTMFSSTPELAALITKSIKQVINTIPIIIKLSPNVPNIGEIGKAVVNEGADAICAVNTMPGMILNHNLKPIVSNKTGGLSGASIKPIALKCVYDLHKSCPKTPIIGTGGIQSGTDVIEMLTVGATLTGIGTIIQNFGHLLIMSIHAQINGYMYSNNITHLWQIKTLV